MLSPLAGRIGGGAGLFVDVVDQAELKAFLGEQALRFVCAGVIGEDVRVVLQHVPAGCILCKLDVPVCLLDLGDQDIVGRLRLFQGFNLCKISPKIATTIKIPIRNMAVTSRLILSDVTTRRAISATGKSGRLQKPRKAGILVSG